MENVQINVGEFAQECVRVQIPTWLYEVKQLAVARKDKKSDKEAWHFYENPVKEAILDANCPILWLQDGKESRKTATKSGG